MGQGCLSRLKRITGPGTEVIMVISAIKWLQSHICVIASDPDEIRGNVAISYLSGLLRRSFLSLLAMTFFTQVLMLLFFTGCGYQANPYLKDVTTVAVPIFDNKTTWREMEFELTNLVHREIKARTSFRLVSHPEDADIIIQGEITGYRKPVIVEDAADNVVVAGSMMTLKVAIKEQKTGKEILAKSRNVQSEFIRGASETVTDAEYRGRQQTLEQLSRWVVSLLEETQ